MKLRSIAVLPFAYFALSFACHAQQPVPQHGVTVKWLYPSGTAVTKFQLSKSAVPGGPYPTVVCTPDASTLTCFDAAPAGSTNYYVVQAFDPVKGWSDVSNESCAGTACVPSTPIPATTTAPTGNAAATK